MTHEEKSLWNRKYEEGSHTLTEPDPFWLNACSDFLAETKPGSALDVAGGVGRHALWLAERGWKVTLIDISEVGLSLARESFRQKGGLRFSGQLETEAMDLSQVHDLGRDQYDLIL